MRLITYIEVKWMTKMVKAYEGEYGSIIIKFLHYMWSTIMFFEGDCITFWCLLNNPRKIYKNTPKSQKPTNKPNKQTKQRVIVNKTLVEIKQNKNCWINLKRVRKRGKWGHKLEEIESKSQDSRFKPSQM